MKSTTEIQFQLERAVICSANHLESYQNADGNIVVWLDCPSCSDKSFCMKVAKVTIKELNMRSFVQETVRVK